MKTLTCPPLQGDRVQQMYATLDEWLRSPALAALVASFGSAMPSHLPLPDLAAWLLAYSERWDFRQQQQGTIAPDTGERSRWLTTEAALTAVQRAGVDHAARELGLIGVEQPQATSYDYLWVLGGARLACLLRARYAAHLLDDHLVQGDAVALLASSRPISTTERSATDTYAPGAHTEFDLIIRAAERVFALSTFHEDRADDADNVQRSWVIRRYAQAANQPQMVAVCAPSSAPEVRRANSADTYQFFFEHLHVPAGTSHLLITSQIYVPYQQLEAVRTVGLKHGVRVETVGFPLAWSGGQPGVNTPSTYLQEIRSTIHAANGFLRDFPR